MAILDSGKFLDSQYTNSLKKTKMPMRARAGMLWSFGGEQM
jgi:hypothetical protein